jgi:flagellar protein FliS
MGFPNPHSAASAASTYAEDSIVNAPPVKIIRLLYEGAIRFIDRAMRTDPHDPQSRFVHWVGRAEDIVVELRCHLARENASEIADTLAQLYLFVEGRFVLAMRERSCEPLQAARDVLSTLLEAWSAVEVEAR